MSNNEQLFDESYKILKMLAVLDQSLKEDSNIQLVTQMDWDQIQTVMIDMDGTLIDLCFDHVIWNHALPQQLAQKRGISPKEAHDLLYSEYRPPFPIDFYSIDAWARKTGLDLMQIHKDTSHLLQYRPGAIQFLEFLKARKLRVVIATNCHPKSFELKDSILNIRSKVDAVYSSADFGVAKDEVEYWDCVEQIESFPRSHTLFIDDAQPILDTGWEAGIGHLMTIKQPNCLIPAVSTFFHPVIDDFRDLLPN